MPYTIQGVELLTKQDYYRPTLLSFIIAVVFCVIFAYCVYHFLYDSIELVMFFSALISIIFLFSCIVPSSPYNKHLSHNYTTEYKVTISDEVPLQTLLSHYEIVSQDGKIYTLKENN